MRDTQTREGFEFWDKLNALPRYAFLLSPSGKSVQKFEDQAMGNWIDVHEAQKVVDQAQEVISELRDELATSHKPDPVLCKFYDVADWFGLVRELVGHVALLQDSAKRNVKPWEDTFPPTLLPAYVERVNADNAAAQQTSTLAVVPELTSELRWILGQMCFQHIHTAQALRLMGHEIARKAEDEQAVTIYWMLGHYLKDPANWRQNATDEMKAAAPAA